jgi:hypothetical protein
MAPVDEWTVTRAVVEPGTGKVTIATGSATYEIEWTKATLSEAFGISYEGDTK